MGNEAPWVARRAKRNPPTGCEPEAKERSPMVVEEGWRGVSGEAVL